MRLYYFLFLIIIVFSCNSPDNSLYVISPPEFIESNITLKEIADDIKYIPLDNSMPLAPFKYVITPNSIYVSAKEIGILKYDREGKFIKQIGHRGRGPGEFRFGIHFTVDEKSGNVFVIDQSKIKTYSNNGIFIRDISLKNVGDGIGWGDDVELFNSLLFLPNLSDIGQTKYIWAFLDTLGNVVNLKMNPTTPFKVDTEGRGGGFYKFDNKIFYYNYFNDTLYAISSDFSYEPRYLFAQGDFRWPKQPFDYDSQVSKIFQYVRMFETKRFISFTSFYKLKLATVFIEKKTKKTFLSYKNEKRQRSYSTTVACLINDLDGGMPLERLEYYSEGDQEYITTLIHPVNLKLYVSGKEFIESKPKYPEKKKELEKLADSLNENDNPVLMLVKLK